MGASTTKCLDLCRSSSFKNEDLLLEEKSPETEKRFPPVDHVGVTSQSAGESALYHIVNKRQGLLSAEENHQMNEAGVPSETEQTQSDTESTLSQKEVQKTVISSSPKVFQFSPVSSEKWEELLKPIMDDPTGVYLLYSPLNNGTWQSKWSKIFVENAWAFSRPNNVQLIPGYKFGKPEALGSGIHGASGTVYQGWIEFIKLARRNHGSFMLLPEFTKSENQELLPHLVILLHHISTQTVQVVRPGDKMIENMQHFDAAGVVNAQRNPNAISSLIGPKVTSTVLATTANRFGQGLVFLEGL